MARKRKENKQPHYQRVEKLLYSYKFMKMGLESMEEELEEITNICGVGSADPGKENFKTNAFHSIVEDASIQNIENPKIKELQDNIYRVKRKLDKLDKAIDELSKEEREVIKAFYFEGKEYYELLKEMNYAERTCRDIKKYAIEKISVALGYSIPSEFEMKVKKAN